MMKRVFPMLVLMLSTCIGTFAQKRLGDYLECDGIPAFVFYLDQSGEHGLAMSIPAFEEKELKKVDKLVKKGLLTVEQAEKLKANPLGPFNGQGSGLKNSKELFAGVLDRLTDNGQNNQEQIVSYCEEKGISLREAFPMQYWAKSLGNGWFIPGDQELTAFASFYFGGLGKKHSLGNNYLKKAKELCNNELIQESLVKMVFYGLFSSSCHHADEGFTKLRHEAIVMKGKNWLDIFDHYVGQAPIVCAVHEF